MQTLLTAHRLGAYVSPIESAPLTNEPQRGYKMSMTRQDFELIARVIKAQRAPHNDTKTLDEVTLEFAYALRDTNPRFDVERFKKACGVSA